MNSFGVLSTRSMILTTVYEITHFKDSIEVPETKKHKIKTISKLFTWKTRQFEIFISLGCPHGSIGKYWMVVDQLL